MTCFTWAPSTTRYSPIWKSWYSSMLVKTEIMFSYFFSFLMLVNSKIIFLTTSILFRSWILQRCEAAVQTICSIRQPTTYWGEEFFATRYVKNYYEALRFFSFENWMLRSEITCIKKPFCRTKRFRKCEKSSFFLRVGELQLPFFSHKNERVSHQNNYKKHKQKITFARCQIIIPFKVC